MNNDGNPNTLSVQLGLNTGESVKLDKQLISLKITSTISQENQLSPTKIFLIAADTDVVQVYKLADETEQVENLFSFPLFSILTPLSQPFPPWSGCLCGDPKPRAAVITLHLKIRSP